MSSRFNGFTQDEICTINSKTDHGKFHVVLLCFHLYSLSFCLPTQISLIILSNRVDNLIFSEKKYRKRSKAYSQTIK